jgi:serine/threonine protein kinase
MRAGDSIQRRYDLIEGVGAGGMGEVWLARDSRLNREVAIKFLSTHFAEDPETLVRFFAEAQSIARIQHPSVVTVLDFGEVDDRPYLVMEHVSGGSLTDLTNGEPILPERALEIISPIAGAAGAAHSIGIVHRDIKPANILLDEDGRPKLCDFGIASSARDAERLTATGMAIGSPHYLSPEQAAGREAVPASDVYSLGVVLYELLTGIRPFDGNNVTAIAIAHVEQEAEPPSTHLHSLSSEIDDLVLRCLQKAPERRFQDGTELLHAIDALDGAAPEAVELWTDAESPTNRSYRRLALVAAVLVALTSLAVFRGLLGDESPPERARAQTDSGPGEEKKNRAPAGAGEVDSTVLPSPTASTTPADDAGDASTEEGESEDEGRIDEELEPESSPSPSEAPEVEPTPTPEVDTPDGDDTPTDLGDPSA